MAQVDLIALTAPDTEDSFDWCLVCGSEEVTHRALWFTRKLDEVARIAWCAGADCQADRALTVPTVLPVQPAAGGGFELDDPPNP